jgi:hypothetical protein
MDDDLKALRAFVQMHAQLSTILPDGARVSEHLESARRQGGTSAVTEGHDECQLPNRYQYLWVWFEELSAHNIRRNSPPLTWADIGAWSQIRSTKPDMSDVAILFMMERWWAEYRPTPRSNHTIHISAAADVESFRKAGKKLAAGMERVLNA